MRKQISPSSQIGEHKLFSKLSDYEFAHTLTHNNSKRRLQSTFLCLSTWQLAKLTAAEQNESAVSEHASSLAG